MTPPKPPTGWVIYGPSLDRFDWNGRFDSRIPLRDLSLRAFWSSSEPYTDDQRTDEYWNGSLSRDGDRTQPYHSVTLRSRSVIRDWEEARRRWRTALVGLRHELEATQKLLQIEFNMLERLESERFDTETVEAI